MNEQFCLHANTIDITMITSLIPVYLSHIHGCIKDEGPCVGKFVTEMFFSEQVSHCSMQCKKTMKDLLIFSGMKR
jgi:hypothetical protein